MNEQRLITVTGTASAKKPANRVEITVLATGEADDYAKAVSKADALSDGAVDGLKAAGLDNIRAGGVNVSVVRDGKKVVGYRAARSFSVSLDYDKTALGNALGALSKSKCEWRVGFSLKDDEGRAALVHQAVEKARESASVIARAAGVALGALVKADYAVGGGAPMLMRAAFGAASDAEPEEITLSETVTCSWEIK